METAIARRRREKAAAPPPALRERRTHEERSAETQSALVEAAISMLCEFGYAGVTTAEVARRAGCTTGAMHHHFGSKEELMLAVLARLSLEFEAKVERFEQFRGSSLRLRCEQAVDLLADYYGEARYVAIWELYVGTRCEPALNQVCLQNRARVIKEFEHVWMAAFADAKVPRAEVVGLMHFTLTFLRSFGLNKSLGSAAGSDDAQLRILKDALLSKLQPKK